MKASKAKVYRFEGPGLLDDIFYFTESPNIFEPSVPALAS